jgi:hypothetical protein
MNNEPLICWRCHLPRYRRDMVGDICLECRERAEDKKAVSFSQLNAGILS